MNLANKYDIKIFAVTKLLCGDLEYAKLCLSCGVHGLADSRIQNLAKYSHLDCLKMMLRIPMLSEIPQVVQLCDIVQVSEVETVYRLNEEAFNQNKVMKIQIMVDLGDLREGMLVDQVMPFVQDIQHLKNIEIYGLSTNLTCLNGVLPDDQNLSNLIILKSQIFNKFGIDIKNLSGGNSSTVYKLLDGSIKNLNQINQLRLGEALIFGTESAFNQCIPHTHQNVFTLKCEIVEVKVKPSIPFGMIGLDAFGNVPIKTEDIGQISRAIVAIGKQDVYAGILPRNPHISIIGSSSDHTILNVGQIPLKVGDIIEFDCKYSGVLFAMTSIYVAKEFDV